MKNFFRSVYIPNRLYYVVAAEVVLLVFGFFFPALFPLGKYILLSLIAVLLIDITVLYANPAGIYARRDTRDKLSNGDENAIRIHIENKYLFSVRLTIIDELPVQFQSRNVKFRSTISSGNTRIIEYKVKPQKRGEYHFGAVNIFAESVLGLLSRRYRFSQDIMVPVYPSFLQMRKYELLAISNHLTDAGIKRIRRIGHNTEFDQIKEYVAGDDYRTINWKATARKHRLMVNQYQDERSQQVYSVIDMGRIMRMPFEGLSLLDYAINSSLVISNIAMLKGDKAGIVTFSDKVQSLLPADRKSAQLNKILQLLYNQRTGYLESDFENLYINVRKKISQRSLVLLYTNFETLSGLRRQLKYLRRLADEHLLVLIFFENTELKELTGRSATNVQEIYNQTIAEKFAFEKKLITRELGKHGIQCILTAPRDLSVNTINKYLELKARGLI